MSEESPVEMQNPCVGVNALSRVSALPVVASTISVMTSYYLATKKSYPSVAPYIEMAEKVTMSAATVAMTTAQPVIHKLGPSLNSYANSGLDKLENVAPIIHEEPDEIYSATKSAMSSLMNKKIGQVISTTDDYVDYYLPDEDDTGCFTKFQEEDEDYINDDTDSECEQEQVTVGEAVQRIKNISYKVRARAYKRAIKRIHGIKKRSDNTLQRLSFTVDLIQYAKDNMDATREQVSTKVKSARESIQDRVDSSQQVVVGVWETLKERTTEATAEMKILARAHALSKNIQENCITIVNSLQENQGYLKARVQQAREIAENMMSSFRNKRSLSEISFSIANTLRTELAVVQELITGVLDHMSENNMFDWIAPDISDDPLEGLGMQELQYDLQLNDEHHDNFQANAELSHVHQHQCQRG